MVAWSERPEGGWTRTLVHDFGAPVWRVSWSVTVSVCHSHWDLEAQEGLHSVLRPAA